MARRLQVLAKHIQSLQVDGENVQVFKGFKVTMDKYVFHYSFLSLEWMMWMLFWDILGWIQLA